MYIATPKPILLDGQPFPFAGFVRWLVDGPPGDYRFNLGGAAVRCGGRILDAVKAAGEAEGAIVDLGKDDCSALQAAAAAPQSAPDKPFDYPLRPTRMLVPFLDAIAGATAEKPAPSVPAPAGGA